jgi:hypothetical protein
LFGRDTHAGEPSNAVHTLRLILARQDQAPRGRGGGGDRSCDIMGAGQRAPSNGFNLQQFREGAGEPMTVPSPRHKSRNMV